jgi:hypothetical protein
MEDHLLMIKYFSFKTHPESPYREFFLRVGPVRIVRKSKRHPNLSLYTYLTPRTRIEWVGFRKAWLAGRAKDNDGYRKDFFLDPIRKLDRANEGSTGLPSRGTGGDVGEYAPTDWRGRMESAFRSR